MAGIYGVYSKEKRDIKDIYNYFYSSTLVNTINEEFEYNTFIYGRSVVNKFLNDRVLYEDQELIIGFEGVFFNKDSNTTFDTLREWYQNQKIDFVKNIKGQFCGFIYDKGLDKLFLFNDHLSTKPLYVYQNNEIFMFASELKVITKLLTELKVEKELDYDAVYSMLTFGYLLNNVTYEKNTKKLNYATILEVDKNLKVAKNKYFHYKKEENTNLSKQEIIDKIDTLLTTSVKNCWGKDLEYAYKHYSLLSGGLDSRVNLLLAKELGHKEVLTMTYSQADSSDEKIAQNIAIQENFKHIFYSLDNGTYLENDLDKYVYANDGLNNFIGVASGYDFLLNILHVNYGALHSGQIGDVLFGSAVKSNFDIKQGMMSDQVNLLENISFIDELRIKYNDNSEIFSYEQRQQHGTLNGDRTLSNLTDLLSPFYDRDLIEFCLTIPDSYKKNEAIYLDWFNDKHTNISDYIWESAGVKPKNIKYVRLAQVIKRYKNALLRRVGFNINDMNPYDVWLRKNKSILNNLDLLFQENIKYITDEKLSEILTGMYHGDIKYSHKGRTNKFLVITFLLAIKLHFGQKMDK